MRRFRSEARSNEARSEAAHRLVNHRVDHAQGMIRGHEIIEMLHRQQAPGNGVGSAHAWLFVLSVRLP